MTRKKAVTPTATAIIIPSAHKLWPLDQLIPYAMNARTHTDAQVDQVAASIKEFGFTNPILVDSQSGIIAGHCRTLAARKLGMVEVPVIVLDHLNDMQRRAYILADNRLALDAGWDNEILSSEWKRLEAEGFGTEVIGFNDADVAGFLDGFEQPSDDAANNSSAGGEDVVPEPPTNPVTRPGDTWIMGDHRLRCGSSTDPADVIILMKGERAVLFATDPPYLVDYDGTNHPANKRHIDKAAKAGKDVDPLAGNKDWSESYGITWDDAEQGAELYENFIKAAIDHAIDPHAAWYCWHASRRQAMLEEVWIKAGAFMHQQIIWNKNASVLTRCTYLWKHEPCMYGWIKGNRPPKVKDEKMMSTVWDINSLAGDERPDHPTPKPLDCFGIPMRQHVPIGGLCYEPFSGSGTQIMAGELERRRVYAMEISPVYVDVGVKRFINKTGKIVFLEGSGGKTFEMVAKERGVDL